MKVLIGTQQVNLVALDPAVDKAIIDIYRACLSGIPANYSKFVTAVTAYLSFLGSSPSLLSKLLATPTVVLRCVNPRTVTRGAFPKHDSQSLLCSIEWLRGPVRFAEAEQPALRRYEDAVRLEQTEQAAKVAERLAPIYDGLGHAGEAAPWRARASPVSRHPDRPSPMPRPTRRARPVQLPPPTIGAHSNPPLLHAPAGG